MAIIRHYLYLSWMQHYGPESLVMVLDFRDTVFQSEPFASVETLRRETGDELWLLGEHMPYKRIKNCVFNSGWIRDCWGKRTVQMVRDEAVICSGAIVGTRVGMEKFERRLLEEVSSAKCHEHYVESDQGYTNLLYHTGALAKAGIKVAMLPRGVGPVNTIGAFSGHRHGYYVGDDVLKMSRDREGYVLNCPLNVTASMRACSPVAKKDSPCVVDGDSGMNFATCQDTSRSPVVHQWDRHSEVLGPFVNRMLSCTKNCYPEKDQGATGGRGAGKLKRSGVPKKVEE